jgi:hypothetical protein
MAIRKSKTREALLNTVARKLGTAAGTVTRVTRELSQDLLVSSRAAEIKAAKKTVKGVPKGTKLEATAQTSRTKATTSTRRGARAVSKRSAHRKSSRTTIRTRRANAVRKAR